MMLKLIMVWEMYSLIAKVMRKPYVPMNGQLHWRQIILPFN